MFEDCTVIHTLALSWVTAKSTTLRSSLVRFFTYTSPWYVFCRSFFYGIISSGTYCSGPLLTCSCLPGTCDFARIFRVRLSRNSRAICLVMTCNQLIVTGAHPAPLFWEPSIKSFIALKVTTTLEEVLLCLIFCFLNNFNYSLFYPWHQAPNPQINR